MCLTTIPKILLIMQQGESLREKLNAEKFLIPSQPEPAKISFPLPNFSATNLTISTFSLCDNDTYSPFEPCTTYPTYK